MALILELADLAAQDAASTTRPTLGQHARAPGLRLFRRPDLLCLRYPRVVAELRGRDLSGLITLETLERQLQTLLQAGYQPVSPSVFAGLSKPVLRRGQRFLTGPFPTGRLPMPALRQRLSRPVSQPCLRGWASPPELTPADAPPAPAAHLPQRAVVARAPRPLRCPPAVADPGAGVGLSTGASPLPAKAEDPADRRSRQEKVDRGGLARIHVADFLVVLLARSLSESRRASSRRIPWRTSHRPKTQPSAHQAPRAQPAAPCPHAYPCEAGSRHD